MKTFNDTNGVYVFQTVRGWSVFDTNHATAFHVNSQELLEHNIAKYEGCCGKIDCEDQRIYQYLINQHTKYGKFTAL